IVEDICVSSKNFAVIQPLLITSRIFGLFPISYSKVADQYVLKWSWIYGMYSYILTISLAIATLVGSIRDIKRDKVDSLRMTDEKTSFVACCDIIIVIVVVIFGIVSLPFKVKKFWKLMKQLNQNHRISTTPLSTQRANEKRKAIQNCDQELTLSYSDEGVDRKGTIPKPFLSKVKLEGNGKAQRKCKRTGRNHNKGPTRDT
ncbi:7TM chemoreceptor, partial [Gonioctena quinquepunctata]